MFFVVQLKNPSLRRAKLLRFMLAYRHPVGKHKCTNVCPPQADFFAVLQCIFEVNVYFVARRRLQIFGCTGVLEGKMLINAAFLEKF